MIVRIVVPVVGSKGLEACLAALFALDKLSVSTGRFPALYESGVRYRREPAARREEWCTIPECLRRGWGDCEDLACWRAAELCVTGQDSQARPVLLRTRNGWHVAVQRGDGSIEDPSRRLGMGRV